MENKIEIALVVVADKPRICRYLTYDNCYCNIYLRVFDLDEENHLSSHDSNKDTEYYYYLELNLSVSSEFIWKGFTFSSETLSYDASYSSKINLRTSEKMLKTLKRIEGRLQKLRRSPETNYFDAIKEFGRSVKAEKIAINDDHNFHYYSFPEDAMKIQTFICKIAHKCYEFSNNFGQKLRFTDAPQSLDSSQTVTLPASHLPANRDKDGGFIGYIRAVVIDDRQLITQTIEYESAGNFCLSEAEFRNTFPIDMAHLLEINKCRENQVNRRFEKFYQKYQVANESGWRSYDRMFIREVSFMDNSIPENPYRRSLTIYAQFEDFDKEALIASIWCDRSGIDLE